MALGWNEVKERAVQFSKEWENAFNEEADSKQFLIDFFGSTVNLVGNFKLTEARSFPENINQGLLSKMHEYQKWPIKPLKNCCTYLQWQPYGLTRN